MAKKKNFGDDAESQSSGDHKMAKVIISTKLGNNKFAYKESMVRKNDVQDFIKNKKS